MSDTTLSHTTSASSTGPVLTSALTALRNAFNAAFPTRDKGSDGWIGDTAHQETVSGHNPDDTPGVQAEYSDADTIPEVRAVDVDKDLNYVGATMQDCINVTIATPGDARRLKYIIYAETIWSKDAGWHPRHYDGPNPHTTHAHFSGDPNYDSDATPWAIQGMGAGMYSEVEMRAFPWQYTGGGIDPDSTLQALNETWRETRELRDRLTRIEEKLDALTPSEPAQVADHTHETGPAIPANVPEE